MNTLGTKFICPILLEIRGYVLVSLKEEILLERSLTRNIKYCEYLIIFSNLEF